MKDKEKRRLMRIREKKKRNRPEFPRLESWRYKRLDKDSWRRPKGLDNKVKEKRKGWHKMPSVGYRGPKKVRGLHPSGKEELMIYRETDLLRADPEKHVLRIAGNIGRKRRVEIENQASILGLRIVNPKPTLTEEIAVEESIGAELDLEDIDIEDLKDIESEVEE